MPAPQVTPSECEQLSLAMKLDPNQPWRVWAFVIGLNLAGLIGAAVLKANGISLFSMRGG
jgi:hypothetical protein